MKREQRYLVFKLSDVHKLGVADWNELVNISAKIDVIRTDRGKQPIECVVVESHWPEYEPTWQALENRFGGGDANSGGEDTYTITQEDIDAIDWHAVHLSVLAHRARKNHTK